MRKIWIMAGEASGDIYGGALAKDLQKVAAANGTAVEIGGMGGAAMEAAGVKRTVDSTELGVVGFLEILKHIFTFIGIFRNVVIKRKLSLNRSIYIWYSRNTGTDCNNRCFFKGKIIHVY